ncbi:MAG: hypothetical protein BWY85_00449 [Firmicutes bacterium ADurb.Bin506]|nr:MAG: hypothetical protein BWY85_00449 [Firmicutes bacterium ADurb.Bin506]
MSAPHNHLTRDIKERGKCPACDETRDRIKKMTMTKPHRKMRRDDLVAWLEVNGGEDERKAFLDNVFDRKAKKLNADQLFDLCMSSYEKAQS